MTKKVLVVWGVEDPWSLVAISAVCGGWDRIRTGTYDNRLFLAPGMGPRVLGFSFLCAVVETV